MAAKMTKPEIINQQVGWCPGCGHGIIQRLIAECCEELGLCEKTIQVVDIACAYWSIAVSYTHLGSSEKAKNIKR